MVIFRLPSPIVELVVGDKRAWCYTFRKLLLLVSGHRSLKKLPLSRSLPFRAKTSERVLESCIDSEYTGGCSLILFTCPYFKVLYSHLLNYCSCQSPSQYSPNPLFNQLVNSGIHPPSEFQNFQLVDTLSMSTRVTSVSSWFSSLKPEKAWVTVTKSLFIAAPY